MFAILIPSLKIWIGFLLIHGAYKIAFYTQHRPYKFLSPIVVATFISCKFIVYIFLNKN